MLGITISNPTNLSTAKLVAGLAFAAALVAVTLPASASPPQRHEEAHRGADHRDDHGRQGWGGGYYPAPPVVYGGWPAQYPPVIYGPGIVLNIR
jgi:hypothetical protein